MSNVGFLLLHPNLKLDGHRREARHEEGRAAAATSRSTTTGRSFHDMGELKNRIESIYEALPSPVSFSGFTAQLAVAVAVRCRPSCDGAAARGRVIAVKNEGIHNPQSDKQHQLSMPPQPRCSYRNSLYYTGTVHVRTYVRHRKQESNMQTCKHARSGFLFVRCAAASLLFRIVPSHSCFSFIRATVHGAGRESMIPWGEYW